MAERHQDVSLLRAQPDSSGDRAFRRLWIVEDDAQTQVRQGVSGVIKERPEIVVQLHRVVAGQPEVTASRTYQAGGLPGKYSKLGRAGLALKMLDFAGARHGVVVAGTNYGANRGFIPGVLDRHLHVAVEVRRDSRWVRAANQAQECKVRADVLLQGAKWKSVDVVSPETLCLMRFQVSNLGLVVRCNQLLRAFAFTPGSVVDIDADLRIAVTSLDESPLRDIVQCIGWARWIRTLNRRRARAVGATADSECATLPRPRTRVVELSSRPNIRLARQQDLQRVTIPPRDRADSSGGPARVLTVMDLFAGAGGLGLGFILAGEAERRYKVIYSGEVEPIYVETLRRNHKYLKERVARCQVPDKLEPLDLRTRKSEMLLAELSRCAGEIDVLIGGPPCQGFSNANRNSWSAKNPHNRLVDVFLGYVRRLQPRFALMENVQGILWTERNGAGSSPSVADHVARSLRRSGYWAFPKLLDAVWYGVPQHRARFFLLAVRKDLGYRPDEFASWGPFPLPTHGPGLDRPYTSVGEAIGDLPPISNGASDETVAYAEPSPRVLAKSSYLATMRAGADRGVVTDHITSRHASYVVDRYRRIPQGGNWQDISDMMTNYAAIDRTHSNIYRRLIDTEPAITIGHYRKSMLVHPTQHRGLSLREAARLQSFPDWFRFAGTADDRPGGLTHKQQQLANAVCPLVAKAIADYLLEL